MEQSHNGAVQAVEQLAKAGCPAADARVLVMGASCGGHCRPGVPCTMRSLRRRGALVDFYDPQVSETNCAGLRARGLGRLSPTDLRRYDLVILEQGEPVDLNEARAVLDLRQ